jgi:hypothetical protein
MTIVAEANNTVYMIVYSTNRKILRRIVIAGEDRHYAVHHKCAAGEWAILVPAGNNDEMPEVNGASAPFEF